MATATKTKRKKASSKKAPRSKSATTRKSASASKSGGKRKASGKRKANGTRKTAAKRATAKSKRQKSGRAAKGSVAVGGLGAAISKSEFARVAKQLQLRIGPDSTGAVEFVLDPREFSSGSFGWFASEKLDVPVGSRKVRCQMSLNVTVIGSKKSR